MNHLIFQQDFQNEVFYDSSNEDDKDNQDMSDVKSSESLNSDTLI
jgi:hypothetical protein